jgi:peptidoglycan/LPS O-acetylase OafA/YrhL
MKIDADRASGHGPRYRPDIDGLRAVAVIPVILYHAGSTAFSGGFVGVDVFFVISGFLITSLIVTDLERKTFSLSGFYQRRIRRIFPALYLMLLASAAVGWVVLLPDDYRALGSSIAATTAFVSNIYFWLQSGYFDPAAAAKPLLHTWSLAVEEQYYILFPVYLMLMYRFFRRNTFWATCLIGIASFCLCLEASYFHVSAAFYLAPTRAWELFIGAAIGLSTQRPRQSFITQAASFAGLALIAAAIFSYRNGTLFPGFAALLPTVGAALFIWAGPGNTANQLLGASVPNFIGRISYPLYLWHWPAMFFARYVEISGLGTAAYAGVIALAVALSIATWALVEQPIRHARFFAQPRRIFPAAAIMTALMMSFGLASFSTGGFLIRVPPDRRAAIVENDRIKNEELWPSECEKNYRRRFLPDTPVVYCTVGNDDRPPETEILFFGDSQVEQIYYALSDLAADGRLGGRRMLMGVYGGCIPLPGLRRVPHSIGTDDLDCDGFSRRIIREALNQEMIKTIVVGGEWGRYFGMTIDSHAIEPDVCQIVPGDECRRFVDSDASLALAKNEMISTFSAFRSRNADVVFMLPFPTYSVPIPDYINRQIIRGKALDLRLTREAYANGVRPIVEMFSEVAERLGARLIDPSELLCPRSECEYQKNMIAKYKNENHISVETAREFAPLLARGLRLR